MAVLTNQKHERFAQELAKGRSQAEAYKRAGYRPSEPNASRLRSNEKVQARLAELQGRAAEKVAITAADIARQLDEDRAFAKKKGQAAAAVSATMGKAKVLGLIIDKTQRELSEEQLRAVLDMVAANPGMAEHLLTQLS